MDERTMSSVSDPQSYGKHALDRRSLLGRAALAGAAMGLAPLAGGGEAHASGLLGGEQHVSPAGSDRNDGSSGESPKRSLPAALEALPAAGGVLRLAQGVYELTEPVRIAGKQVEVACEPGAVLRASRAMEAVLVYEGVVDSPGIGAHGLAIDMAGLAATGLELRDSWLTDHTLRVLNPGAGTAVVIRTTNPAFGCYYNRVLVKCVPPLAAGGAPVPGSRGVLIEGQGPDNKTNHNTLADSRLGNLATGIRIGAYTDANTLLRPDCTRCSVGYDLSSGDTHLVGAWEEQNDVGFVVRRGAVARVSALYSEKHRVEGDGVLYLDGHVISGADATRPVKRLRARSGGPELRESWDPRDGTLSWEAAGTTLLGIRPGGGTFHGSYDEFAAVPTPGAPGAGAVRLFARRAPGGEAELCVRMPSGGVTVLASDAPRAKPGRRERRARRKLRRRGRRARRKRRRRGRRARG